MIGPRQPGRNAALGGLCAVSIVLVLASHYDGTGGYPVIGFCALLGAPLVPFVLTVIVKSCMRLAHDSVGASLNCRPLVFIVALSYAPYLWQQPFLKRDFAEAFCQFPLNLFLVVLVALVSYLLIERPLLALRHRFAVAPRIAAIA